LTLDVSRSSIDAFIKAFGLDSTVTTSLKCTTTKAEVWDLAPFTKFDAYGAEHFGTV
jgi:hypothetical protein